MREGQFIRQNIEKWKIYQYEPTKDPDEMADRFTELVNDLGYAKTFYPQSKVTVYLNTSWLRLSIWGFIKIKKKSHPGSAGFGKRNFPWSSGNITGSCCMPF